MLWSALVCQAFYSHLFVLLLRPITSIDYRLSQLQHESTLRNIQHLTEKPQEASAKLADAKRGREDDRRSKLAALKIKATEELNALKRNDPQAIADLEKELELVKGAANRWMDNIFACKDYLVKKRGVDKNFGDYGCV